MNIDTEGSYLFCKCAFWLLQSVEKMGNFHFLSEFSAKIILKVIHISKYISIHLNYCKKLYSDK